MGAPFFIEFISTVVETQGLQTRTRDEGFGREAELRKHRDSKWSEGLAGWIYNPGSRQLPIS